MKISMPRLALIWLFILTTQQGLTQQVTVFDARSGHPVEGVILSSEYFTTQTDQEGVANLETFGENNEIVFRHSSYLKYKSTRAKIVRQGNIVLLVEDPVRLDEVVISVNRWDQSKAEVPFKVASVKISELNTINPQTTADLLGTQEGVFIQKSQMGGGSPMIRGFSANRLLIVVDGIRMNNAIYRSGNLHNVISLDANELENTEIIFGPGSVIYGSDALGGVMSFNTLKPRLSTTGKSISSGKSMIRFSSANFEKTFHGMTGFGNDKLAGLAGCTFTDFDDLRMGKDGPEEYLRPEYVLDNKFIGTDQIVQNQNPLVQRYTGYSQFNIMGKLRFRPHEKLELNLGLHYSQISDLPRYDRLIVYRSGKLRYGDWFYGPQKWGMVSVHGNLEEKKKLFDKVSFTAGYQNWVESRNDRNLNSPELNIRTENLDILSVNIDFDKHVSRNSEIFYGFESFWNRVGSEGFSRNLLSGQESEIDSRYPDGSVYSSIAGYFSFKLNLKKRYIFQGGARYTYNHLEGEFSTQFYDFPFTWFSNNHSALNGNVGIVWHPDPGWQLNASVSTGFRAPNLDDAAKVFESVPGSVLVPNPDMKPEYALNYEMGVIRSLANKARIEITAFYTHLKDAMVRRDFLFNGRDSILYDGSMSKVEALVNAESATIYGAGFSFEFLFNNLLRTKNELTVIEGKDSEDMPLRHVPPAFGSSHLIFENQKAFIDFYIQYCGKFDFDELEQSEREKPYMYAIDEMGRPWSPSWWTMNLKSSFKINRTVTLSGGIENILDKRYRPYSSGIVSPGINFTVSLTVKF